MTPYTSTLLETGSHYVFLASLKVTMYTRLSTGLQLLILLPPSQPFMKPIGLLKHSLLAALDVL